MPQLDISTYFSQFFWLLISFIILYYLLNRFFLPKLNNILLEREATISEALRAANCAKEEALKLKEEYEEILSNAADTRSEMIERTSKKISISIEESLFKLDDELKKLVSESEIRIENYLKNAEKDVDFISMEATKAILSSLSDEKIDEKLLSNVIKKIKSEGNHVI
ncbi:MAG: hypothetical protein AABY27_01745 [Pseudomonadota bacterium]